MTTAALDDYCLLQPGMHVPSAVVLPWTVVPTVPSRNCSSVVTELTCPGTACPFALQDGLLQLVKGGNIHDVRVPELARHSKEGRLHQDQHHSQHL
jgi:hypothetical protein